MSLNKTFITFIVPAYNVENTVSETINSLLEQTDDGFRIVIVNDGSTDNTDSICREFYETHQDIITYLKQDNKGLGAARNAGLKTVDTEYVSFIDSDDIQDRKFVEELRKRLLSYDVNPDILITLPTIFDMATNRTIDWFDRKILETSVLSNENKNSNEVFIASGNPWVYLLEVNACRKVYSVHFLNSQDFSFPEGLKWEDIPSHFALLHNAKSIGFLETGFFYRINGGNQITKSKGKGRLDIIPIFNQLLDIILDGSWKPLELAYAVRLIVSYSKWFIDETQIDYIDQLLEGLHKVYLRIPKRVFNTYLNTCSPHKRKEKLMYYILRSHFYRLYNDYRLRGDIKSILSIVRK